MVQPTTKVIGKAETRTTAPIRIGPARNLVRGSTASAATAANKPAAVIASQNP